MVSKHTSGSDTPPRWPALRAFPPPTCCGLWLLTWSLQISIREGIIGWGFSEASGCASWWARKCCSAHARSGFSALALLHILLHLPSPLNLYSLLLLALFFVPFALRGHLARRLGWRERKKGELRDQIRAKNGCGMWYAVLDCEDAGALNEFCSRFALWQLYFVGCTLFACCVRVEAKCCVLCIVCAQNSCKQTHPNI